MKKSLTTEAASFLRPIPRKLIVLFIDYPFWVRGISGGHRTLSYLKIGVWLSMETGYLIHVKNIIVITRG